MNQPVKWGIIGCGGIAPKFALSLEKTGEGRVAAAASKSMRRAGRFGRLNGVERVYGSYGEMLEREPLDAVYIANTHAEHAAAAGLCLNRGLPVLVEKSFTRNAQEAADVIALAREKNCFCMEAMWTRFNPAVLKLRELLAGGTIGEVRHLRAAFCLRMNPLLPKMMPWNRMYNPRLAGGALLDLGVYAVSFARMVFGREPERISSSSVLAWTGVDTSSEYVFDYPGGKRAELKASFRQDGGREALITGSDGIIRIPGFMQPSRLVVSRPGRAVENLDIPPDRLDDGRAGFQHQIREVHRCLREGLTESPLMPLDETSGIMQTMDALRAQWGMKFPGE